MGFLYCSIFLVVTLLSLHLTWASYNKLYYQVDPTYQNTIDSDIGRISLPTFSTTPVYIVLGGIFSLTFTNGKLDLSGYQNLLALQCAVGEMNVIGPQRNMDTKWYYQVFNDQSNAATSMRAAVELLEAGVVVTIGPTDAEAAVSVSSLSESFNVTKLDGSVTLDQLSDPSTYGSFFRTVPPDTYIAETIGNICLNFSWSLITPIFTDDSYGRNGLRAFTEVATSFGILSTCGRIITPGTVNGIQNTISCLSNSQSSVVLLWMQKQDAFNVISSLYESGTLNDLTFIATPAWGDIQDVQYYAEGRFPNSYLEGAISVIPDPGNQNILLECIRNKLLNTSVIPFYDEFLEDELRCYLPGTSEARTLSRCPSDFFARAPFPDFNCTCSVMDDLASVPPLWQVNYIYDAAFAVFNAFDQLANNCTGLEASTGLELCSPNDRISTADLKAIINQTHFMGVTGLVAFNNNDPIRIEFDILQRRSNGSLAIVGHARGRQGNITALDDSLLIWKSNGVPVSAIVPSEITFTDPLGYVALIFIVIGLLIAFACAIYFYVNRKEKVIKKTSPFFSQLMLLGIILCIVSQIFWDLSQSQLTCTLKVWFLAIGFGLIMGNLLAKTWRIFKIFNNARVTSLVIRDVDLLKFTGAVLLMEIILLSVYCFSSGLPRPVAIQSTSDSLLKIVQCQVPSNTLQVAGIIVLFTVNFLLVLAAVIVAFLTRNVDSAFNESLYITYVVYIYLLVATILLPLYYTAGDSASSNSRQFIIRTIAILVSMYFTLAALFGPKIYLVMKQKKAERKLAKANRDREPGRRVIEFTSTGGGRSEGQSGYLRDTTASGGAFTRAIRSTAPSHTATSSEDEVATIMPGGPRASSTRSSSETLRADGGSTTLRPKRSSSEYGQLIQSMTKKNK